MIQLASPDTIRRWSYGEVTKPETINYRTFKPEKDGLFCERIFGPVKDWECNCGKYKRIRYRGMVCDRAASRSRRARCAASGWATSSWPCPSPTSGSSRALPSRIGHLLDMTVKDLERILYYESYVVIDPGNTDAAGQGDSSPRRSTWSLDEQPDRSCSTPRWAPRRSASC